MQQMHSSLVQAIYQLTCFFQQTKNAQNAQMHIRSVAFYFFIVYGAVPFYHVKYYGYAQRPDL